MSARDEVISHYTDQDLQVTVDRDPGKWTTGNGLLHSGLFICMLHGSDQIERTDMLRFSNAVEMCEVVPGVYDRNQGRKDQNAHDDAVGVVSGSVLCNLHFNIDVLWHGITHLFCYDNVDNKFNGIKDLWSFRGRFPVHIAWYFALGNKLFLPTVLLVLTSIALNKNTTKSDVKLQAYCMLESLSCKYEFLSGFRSWWLKGANLPGAVASYFGQDHPLVKLSTQIKF